MPTIPVYNQPTASLAPLRPSGMNVQAPIEAFGGQVGNTLGRLSGQVSEDIARAKAQAENDKAEDTFTKLSEWKIQKWNEASQKQGENALNVHADYMKQYDEQAKELESSMTPGAAYKFKQAASRGRLAFSEELMHHQTRQAGELQKTIAETGFQTMMDSASVTPIHDAAVMYANRAGALAAKEADRQGLTGDSRDVLVKEWRGRVLAAHIEATMKVDPYKATAFYEEHKGEFTGKDAAVLKKWVDGQTMANTVMSQGERISSLPEDQQLAEVDKISGGKPEFREALRAEVLHRVEAKKALQRATEEQAIGRVMDRRFPTKQGQKQQSLPEIMKTDDWMLRITPQNRRKLIESWKDEERERAQGTKDPDLDAERYAVFLDIKDRPELLMGMDDYQIIGRWRQTLGAGLTKKVLDEKHRMQIEGAPKIDKDSFNSIAVDNGIPINSGRKKDKALVGKLWDRAEEEVISIEKARGGKRLTRDETAQVIKGLSRKVQLEEYGKFWNSTYTKYLFEITPEEIDASIVADPAKFQSILTDLEKEGLEPTRDRLRNAYLMRYSEKDSK